MWKVILGFVVFAAIALFVIMKGGDKIDMAGERHDSAPGTPEAASAPASAASN